MLYRLLAVLLCLGIVPTAFAQSGTLSASPSVVVIPIGGSVGDTNMTWTASGASAFHVTVNCGGGEQLMASTSAGTHSVNVPWIQIGSSCTFRLRSWTVTGTVLSTVTVIGVTTNGAITGVPTTVVIPPGQSVGSTNIGWVGEYGSTFHVTVDCGGGEQLMGSTGAGTHSVTAPWITVGASCLFRLRSETVNGPILDSVTVTGVAGTGPTPSGSISVSPNTVSIPAGQSSGSTTVSWNGQNASGFVVTGDCGSGEAPFASSGAGSYSQVAAWITVGASCVFRLRADSASGPLLGSANVTGVAGQSVSGSISASPTTVTIPVGQSTGSTTLSWNSAGASQAYVMSSCAGAAQSTFATSGAGSFNQAANIIPVGASCIFQLRANATNGPLLGSVTVTGQQAQGVPPITTHRGGSNHNFYRHPASAPDGGYNYGIMLHYHESGVRETVQSQLQQMYAGGQRSLRVMVFFAHSPGETITTSPAETSRKCRSTGTKTCPPGDEYFIPLQYQNNIRTYLNDIRAAGFERVMIALGPQWINDFMSCNNSAIPASLRQQLYAGSPLVNELFEEAWGVAKEVRAIAVDSGMPYLIDLGNEYIPPSNLAAHGQCAKDIVEGTANSPGYLRFLWGRYVAAYGNQDTVGFSVIVGNSWDADNRLARMPQFLSPLPSVYSLHSYTSSGDITGGLNRAYQVTGNFGRRPWIIGETDSRSPAAADAIRSFIINRPQQQVLHAMQWPGFNCTTEAQCLPLDFSAFSSRGF
jgi:hypothetical protein